MKKCICGINRPVEKKSHALKFIFLALVSFAFILFQAVAIFNCTSNNSGDRDAREGLKPSPASGNRSSGGETSVRKSEAEMLSWLEREGGFASRFKLESSTGDMPNQIIILEKPVSLDNFISEYGKADTTGEGQLMNPSNFPTQSSCHAHHYGNVILMVKDNKILEVHGDF